MLTVKKDSKKIKLSAPTVKDDSFLKDVLSGLQAESKHLYSKYFYDKAGDELFQQIMDCNEYYPFKCELEIFSEQTETLAQVVTKGDKKIDLIELGAGDCTKTSYLLAELVNLDSDFTYLPIDISENIIEYLNGHLPLTIPGLRVNGLNGDYFEMLSHAANHSERKKVVLFLGSNIGNMPPKEATKFCMKLRQNLHPGDIVVIGIDLKKNPKTILAAYNDKEGITREFNLNLLRRINRELNANFDVNEFEHYPMYDPETGGCKSYLISNKNQQVMIPADGNVIKINFKENEPIFMEISQKYSIKEIEGLAREARFQPVANLFDKRGWFMDAIWSAV